VILHRITQFARAGAPPTPADFAVAKQHLPPSLFELFKSQHPRDIVHSAHTALWLLERGHQDPDLIAAALLHDIGKGPQRRLDRTAWVLAHAAHVEEVFAKPGSRFEIRRALARSAAHSERGAELLVSAGASERVVALTRAHHSPPAGDPVLALLQQADAQN
jgi:putative nucleotidyltransferase with HDIG domain